MTTTAHDRQMPQPLYQQVKNHIVAKISAGKLQPGMRIDSENELVQAFGVSRMTVHRALRELTAEGRLTRLQGVGTFVASRKPQSAMFEIVPINEEIVKRGGTHSCEVLLLQEERANPQLAGDFALPAYSPVFHALLLHKENEIPVQLADRYINPAIAGDFLNQDFNRITPSAYLLSLFPVSEVEHVIEAIAPDRWIQSHLGINEAEPCLVLRRRTWVEQIVATQSTFYYPGSRHSIGGRFRPSAPGTIQIA
jgi:GntR family transcriptional regulator, histidine utilization repressor